MLRLNVLPGKTYPVLLPPLTLTFEIVTPAKLGFVRSVSCTGAAPASKTAPDIIPSWDIKMVRITKTSKIKVKHILHDDEDQGIEISCEVAVKYGQEIPALIRMVQNKIKEAIEFMTGMIVHQVNITVQTLRVGI